MTGNLTTVGSYVTAPEADLARIRLAQEGIRARLANAALVTWCWHYSNAAGGVRLLVAGSDAERAWEILSSEDGEEDETPEWTCAACARRVPGPWETCWHCGTSAGGRPDPAFEAEEAPAGPIEPQSVGCLLVFFVLLGSLAAISGEGIIAPMLVVAVATCGVMLVTELTFGRDVLPEFEPAREDVTVEAPVVESDESGPEGEAAAERAWRAAVFGLLIFSLFTLISLWLLARDTPAGPTLSRAGRCKRGAAWVVNLLNVLAWQWAVMSLLAGVYGLLEYGLDFFFNLQDMRPTW